MQHNYIPTKSKNSCRLSVAAVLLTLTFAVLTGCGNDKTSDNHTALNHSTSAGESSTESVQSSTEPTGEPEASTEASSQAATSPAEAGSADDSKTNRFEVAGIQDPKAFIQMFESLQKTVAQGDKEKVADYILYPLSVHERGNTLTVKDKTNFLAKYEQIFTPAVQQALVNQETDKLFVNYQGVMVGSGELWLRRSSDDPKQFGVFTVNIPGTDE